MSEPQPVLRHPFCRPRCGELGGVRAGVINSPVAILLTIAARPMASAGRALGIRAALHQP